MHFCKANIVVPLLSLQTLHAERPFLYVCYHILVSSLVQVGCGHLSFNSTLHLDGSPLSHASFPIWSRCESDVGSADKLRFDFRSLYSHALLLYTDSEGGPSFLQLKLVDGAVQLRYKYGVGGDEEMLVTTGGGGELRVGEWHRIEIVLGDGQSPVSRLTVDGHSARGRKSMTSRTMTSTSGIPFKSPLYVGGVPESHVINMSQRSLPSVAMETRLTGSISALTYTNCGSDTENIEVIGSVGTRSVVEDLCVISNPCTNEGRCFSSERGPRCDCTKTHYTGTRCHQGLTVFILS